MNERNFFAELRRRNVYKVAVAYAVVAWLLIQAASIFFPAFDAPPWVMKIFIIVIIFGFPVALIFSWAFEITPEGIKLESEIEPNKSIAQGTGRKIVAVTIALAVVAAGLFVYQVGRIRSTITPRQSEAATVSKKSIAVLPFDNLSRDPDNAYFCEGVQDEILTRLARVADLKVISRTSTQHFKSTPENLPQIAKQLGVAHILEGSVQKAGGQVRVNVQLINAMTDAHLWADTYDRKLTDIFAVESDIAKTIAETLQAKITGSEKNSIAYLLLPNYGGAPTADVVPPARAAVTKALELDDSLAEAHASLGLLDTLDLRLERAITHFERAVQLKPNYATAHHWLGLGHLSLGHFDQAIAEEKRATELDPLSVIINADFAWTYACAHRLDEAEAQARRTLEIDPRFFLAHYYLGGVHQAKGQLPEAISEFRQAFDLNGDSYSLAMLGQAYARTGNKAEAQKILARLNEEAKSRHVAPYAWALLYLGLGDKNRALDELETAYQRGDTNYLFVLKVDPLFDDLRGQPRFDALVRKIVGGNQ